MPTNTDRQRNWFTSQVPAPGVVHTRQPTYRSGCPGGLDEALAHV